MIEIKNLRKSFNGKTVLNGINLVIPDGISMVIIGCSGCGKTVLLKMIIGLIKPDEGSITIDGEPLVSLQKKDLYRIRTNFGMLFQGGALFDSMNVEGNISLALHEHTQLSKSDIHKRVKDKLEVVGLRGVEKKMVSELSGGMKKRVGLARALIMNPKFVLFDEPTTGLDPMMADNINQLILETHRSLNITSLIVTHDIQSALKVGDRIGMIQDGLIVFEGTTSEFKKSHQAIVKQFIKGRR